MAGMNEKRQTDLAIDTIASMVIYDLVSESGKDPETVFNEFYSSKTCETLYDESTKLWWCGPAYIVGMYKEELEYKKNLSSYHN